jgi:F-type H+-transporting ATPase subunit a
MLFAIPPLVAEPIFHLGNFPVTNTYINSWLGVLFFVVMAYLLRNTTRLVPRGIQNAAESVLEFILGYIDNLTKDRSRSLQFLPIVGGLFLFILFSNWVGLVPGTGSIYRNISVDHGIEQAPIFRPANTDLNMTLAMGISAVVISHVLGIIAIGFWKYGNKYIKVGDFVRSFRKGGMAVAIAVIEFAVGLIEIFSEIAKMVSLSLRLFGNVFAGEVLLTVLASLIAFFVPLPFMFLELLVGLIQAVVFAMLTLVYLTMATTPVLDEAHGH